MAIDKYDLDMVNEWIGLYLKKNSQNENQETKDANTKYLILKLESKFMSDFTDEVTKDFKTTIFPGYIYGKDYNLLNISIALKNNLLFDWCIDKGFDPNFVATTGKYFANTEKSIVLSAYEGNIYTLEKLIKIGIDPVGVFQSGHNVVRGGTLLHQVMSNHIIMNKEDVIKTLSNAYPHFNMKDYNGMSIIDVSVDNIGVDYIKEKIVENEKKLLMEVISKNHEHDTKVKKRL